MLDLLFLSLLLLAIAGVAFLTMLYARNLREASRSRARRVFLPPPDVARALIEKRQDEQAARGDQQSRTQLPPLDVPLSQQRLCLHCGTTNLREAATCRKCGGLMGEVESKRPGHDSGHAQPHSFPKGPLYAVLIAVILASIGAILFQVARLGARL